MVGSVQDEKVLTRDSSIYSLADSYARVWNIAFANNVLRYLPRELRDAVYGEIVSLYNPTRPRVEHNRNFTPTYDPDWNALTSAVGYNSPAIF